MIVQQPPSGTPINKQHPLSQGLVGYWPLNEGGGKLAFDASGLNIIPGAFNGSSIVSKISTRGKCVSFTAGSSDYINCGNKSQVNVASSFTLGWWVNRAAGTLCHAGKYSGAGSDKAFLLQIFSDNNIYFVVTIPAGTDPYVTCAMPSATNGNWAFVVGVFNPTLSGMTNIGKIYINGVQQTTTSSATYPSSVNQSTENFRINVYNASTYGTCLMQNVVLYNRALSATEIRQLYINSYQMFQQARPLKLAV